MGTEHACEALDGCLQPEEFNSPVLRSGRPANFELSYQTCPSCLDLGIREALA